jgi:serine/threonine-protein kinase
MAQVYRALDHQLDRPVALKVLFPELSVDRAFVERFRREAQAAANLSHPNIVPVFDWGHDDGTYYIVMEYVEGRPLSAVIRDPEPLPPQEIATIGASVAAALAFAHRHSVVHRDIKPGNVLLTPDKQVKVTDFGIARAVNTDESLTQTGAVMGTAAYFSPEQAEGKLVDARSDIYSLGVVLYEMCVGRPPFTGDSPVAVASKHVRDDPVLPRDANPAVPAALEAVVMKAMAKNPDDRYASAEELRADLLRFADGRPVEAGDPAVTSLMAAAGATSTMMMTSRTQALPPVDQAQLEKADEAERKKRTRRLIALLIVLLVALGVIAYFLLRSVGVFGATVTVPNVVGDTRAAATQTLQNDQLTVGRTTYRADKAARGIVLSTDPSAGALVSKNSAVDLVVSNGPRTVPVPNVVGELSTNAGATLTRAGLSVGGTSSECSNQYPSGTVSGQNPTVGNSVSAGTTVDIVISSGSCAPPTTAPPPPTTTTTTAPPTTTTTAPPTTTTTAPPTTTTTAPPTTTTTAPPTTTTPTTPPAALPPPRGHNGQ